VEENESGTAIWHTALMSVLTSISMRPAFSPSIPTSKNTFGRAALRSDCVDERERDREGEREKGEKANKSQTKTMINVLKHTQRQ
jgi:hypothetical protein